MSGATFTALLVEQTEPKTFTRSIVQRHLEDLPEGELLVSVEYSSLNYKDALSATGHPGVSRKFPHTPGIDAAGEVIEDASGTFTAGDPVILTGFDLGMNTPGGLGQRVRVPANWALPLPTGLSLRESMALGTAGLTAGLCVQRLLDAGVTANSGDILVTGATGGVGSLAVGILARAGFRPVAASGKLEAAAFLRELGATDTISREDVLAGAEKPMMRERWAGVVDVVGGDMLAAAIKATHYGGAVTCCGLVGSAELNLNVYPFILRGVSLHGIDSVQCPLAKRQEVWDKLAGPWKLQNLDETVTEIGLDGVEEKIMDLLQGKVTGRTLVNLV